MGTENNEHHVIVIGAGPAGIMAAGQAARRGADVLLIEKMDRPACKLRITGKGRCNLTNLAPISDFIQHFGRNGRFLHQSFARFFTTDLISFFEDLGVPTVVERGGRVFPASQHAQDIVESLVTWLDRNCVTQQMHASVAALIITGGQVVGVRLADGRNYSADAVVIATGGASYPGTGSTGDGYRLAESVGHSIIPIRPALVPLETSGDIAPALQGLSLRNVAVKLLIDGKCAADGFGEMLFTHFGISGPIILTLSKVAVDALRNHHKVGVSIDLKPALDEQTLDARLLRDINTYNKRQFRTLLKELLPRKLIPICIDLTGIPADKPAHQITATERKRLLDWLKSFQLDVIRHRPLAEAIVTAGGVNTQEIDPRTMASRLVEGLYFAGEILDIDADTGGYNLQAAFSTGWLAGQSAAQPRIT